MKLKAIIGTAAVLFLAVLPLSAGVYQNQYTALVNTNSGAVTTNTVGMSTDMGWFQKIQATLPIGLSNASLGIMDFDGTTLLRANNLQGVSDAVTKITLWSGTNVLHGGWSIVTSNGVCWSTNSTGLSVTASNLVLTVLQVK